MTMMAWEGTASPASAKRRSTAALVIAITYISIVVGELVPEFERQNPGIRVDVQQIPWSAAHEKLLTAHVGDATPDIAQLGNTWIAEFEALDVTVVRGLASANLEAMATLAEMYIKMMLEDGVFHADPHAGNLLVDGAGRLVLRDLNCDALSSGHEPRPGRALPVRARARAGAGAGPRRAPARRRPPRGGSATATASRSRR